MITFATEHGYWDAANGEPFRFADAYCPATPQKLRYTATRVWSMLRRARRRGTGRSTTTAASPAPSPIPLWIKPDAKLSVADVFAIMRDHYEGTPYDMTQGVDAGPFGSPVRPDPMAFEVDGAEAHLGTADLDQEDRLLLRLAVPRLAARRRSAACTGTASTTPTPPATSRSTAASTPCPPPTPPAR